MLLLQSRTSCSTSFELQSHGNHRHWEDNSKLTPYDASPTLNSIIQLINLISGSNLRVGMGLNSCTYEVQVAPPFKLDGRSITLVDTPGFDDTEKSL
jgi:hypothetical protein